MSSGRRRASRFNGASVTTTRPAMARHAVRHPAPAISRWSQGRMTTAQTPTPENATPIASPRRQAEAGGRERHAEEHHRARAAPVHHPAEDGAEDRRHQEAEREGAGGDSARPAELVEDRREEERERGARVDADAHRDERDRNDEPAVEETRRG